MTHHLAHLNIVVRFSQVDVLHSSSGKKYPAPKNEISQEGFLNTQFIIFETGSAIEADCMENVEITRLLGDDDRNALSKFIRLNKWRRSTISYNEKSIYQIRRSRETKCKS